MKQGAVPRDIRALASVLDKKYQGPFNLKFGLDSIIGLIPIWGDSISFILSSYIIVRSAQLKCPTSIIIKMLMNSLIDFIIGSIPFLGDVFDLYWKANIKNTKLLESYMARPKRVNQNALPTILFACGIVFSVIALSLWALSSISK